MITNVIGLMSGSSLDGLDLVCCKFSGTDNISWQILASKSVPFEMDLQAKLEKADQLDARSLYKLDSEFALFCSTEINKFVKSIDCNVGLIASHGHTIYHHPEEKYSVQIGNPGILAALTGIDCIGDFRIGDIALGGQGAPLAPIVEKILFTGYPFYLNLGGIANLSIHHKDVITSWDISPCNQILNHYARTLGKPYDLDGNISRTGNMHSGLLERMMHLSYFHQKPPKSLDNQWNKSHLIPLIDEYKISSADKLATCTYMIAQLITRDLLPNHRDEKKQLVFVSGGGAHNKFLIESINNQLQPYRIECYIPPKLTIDMKEAILMALMGYLRVNKLPNTLPSVTGATRSISAGAWYCP